MTRKNDPKVLLGLVAGMLFLCAPGALAQVDDPAALVAGADERVGSEESWGSSSESIYNLGPDDFSVRLAGWANADLLNNSSIHPANDGSTLLLSGPIHLPAGALVTRFTIFFSDTHTGADPSGSFWRASTFGELASMQQLVFPPGFSNGNASVTFNLPTPGLQIDNLNYVYAINVSLPRATALQETRLYRVRVRYRLQVSPAPANASFPGDVPTSHPFFRFVEALAAAGISGGCGTGSYCPDQPVTRGQMAVFLATALGLHFPD